MKNQLKLACYYMVTYTLSGLYHTLGMLKQHVAQLALEKHKEVTGQDILKEVEQIIGGGKNAN